MITAEVSRNWFGIGEWTDYMVDTAQRSILFWDRIRKQGNNYLSHINEDPPPVSACDGLDFEKWWEDFFTMTDEEISFKMLQQLHPLRVRGYAFSDLNPMMWPLGPVAQWVKENRQPLEGDNWFKEQEETMGRNIQDSLKAYGKIRDTGREQIFYMIHDHPYVKFLFAHLSGMAETGTEEETRGAEQAVEDETETDRAEWMDEVGKGGFQEAAIRVMLAVAGVDHAFDKKEYQAAEKLAKQNMRLRFIKIQDFREMVKVQSRIFHTDPQKAIAALPAMLETEKDRKEVLNIAHTIAAADEIIHDKEKRLLNTIESLLI